MNRLVVVALVCVLWSHAAIGHPFHTTVLEADWVASSRQLEAALRVDPEALNEVFLQRRGQPLNLAPLEGPRSDLAAFITDAVEVRGRDGTIAPIDYRGHKVERDGVWLFFVVSLEGGMKGATLISRAFVDREPKQMNAVLVREKDDLVFSKVFTGRNLTPARLW